MQLFNCEINLTLTESENCFLVARTVANQVPIFIMTDTKLYVPVVTLSTQNNTKLLQQLKSGFKRTINWNKYRSTMTTQAQNRNLEFLIDPSFKGDHRLFVLSFENENEWRSYKQYYFSTVEIKYYKVVIDRRSFLDQPVQNNLRTYDNIRKFTTSQR